MIKTIIFTIIIVGILSLTGMLGHVATFSANLLSGIFNVIVEAVRGS